MTLLNQRGMVSGGGKPFSLRIVQRIRRDYGLKPRYDRLREAGMLTLGEMAELLRVTPTTVKIWRARALLRAHR